jgi:hypothetical protein
MVKAYNRPLKKLSRYEIESHILPLDMLRFHLKHIFFLNQRVLHVNTSNSDCSLKIKQTQKGNFALEVHHKVDKNSIAQPTFFYISKL